MKRLKILIKPLASLELTIACLGLLMLLVFLCTLDQVHLGTYGAVKKYFRHAFLYWTPSGSGWRIPLFPAGGCVGAVLLLNLIASHWTRFKARLGKAGIWLIHSGLILLVLGEFLTGLFAVETQMPIEIGQTRDYTESVYDIELAVVDATDPGTDEVTSIPESYLQPGSEIRTRLPFTLMVKRYYENAALGRRPEGDSGPASMATAGIGPSITVMPLAPVAAEDQRNQPAAFVEAADGDRSLGTWLVSTALGAKQSFSYAGRSYELYLRPKRYYLPYKITLKEFRHDLYAGTDIPKNFSSLIRLADPSQGVDRDVLIYMNHPLRYAGKTFYQASFGKNDSLSVLQVVRNPGWLLPYASFILIGFGLLTQFLIHLLAFAGAAA